MIYGDLIDCFFYVNHQDFLYIEKTVIFLYMIFKSTNIHDNLRLLCHFCIQIHIYNVLQMNNFIICKYPKKEIDFFLFWENVNAKNSG